MRRLIENVKFTDIRIEPTGIWTKYSNLFTESFGELKGDDLIEKLYVSKRIRSTDEFWLLSHLLRISIDDVKNIYLNIESGNNLKLTLHNNPILIKGREGTGKSTYLKYHLEYIANSKLNLKILPLFIDYKAGPPGKDNILKFSIDSVNNKLLSFLGMYYNEKNIFSNLELRDKILTNQYLAYKTLFDRLEALNNSIEIEELKERIFLNLDNDKSSLNRLMADYVQCELGFKIILISDNLDHHLDDTYISKVIEVSMFEKASLNTNLIICVRDYNYGIAAKARLRAFDYHVFDLTPPDLTVILNKRVNYVISKVINFDDFTISETKDKIDFLLEESERTILGDFAGDNIRLLLSSAKRILSSGHLKFYRDTKANKYKIELHDFIRSLMLGNRQYFMPPEYDNQCEVINLFENGNPYSYGNNLIRIRILQIMKNEGQFIERKNIINKMSLLGYEKEEIHSTIRNLANYELIESSEIGNRSLRFLTFTEKGKYHLNTLLYELTFYDEIRSATYLPDPEYNQILKSRLSTSKSTITQRMNEIEQFVDYLLVQENKEKMYVRNKIKALVVYNNITYLSKVFSVIIQKIHSIRNKNTANNR